MNSCGIYRTHQVLLPEAGATEAKGICYLPRRSFQSKTKIDRGRLGARDVSAEGTSLAGPSVRVRVSEKRTQFILTSCFRWVNISAQLFRYTRSIKRRMDSGIIELGTGYQALQPQHPTSGQQQLSTSYSPPPRSLHSSSPRAP